MPWAALRREGSLAIEQTPLARMITLRAFPARSNSRSAPVVFGDFDINSGLLDARKEAIEVAKEFGVEALIGSDATQAKFFAASEASVLYLAGHANPSRLLGAFLPIHNEKRPKDKDGGISEREIRLRKVGPGIVVLSSCMGSDATDDFGWKSLTGAFIEAGSRAVIASPSTVSDQETQKLSSLLDLDLLKSDPVRALARAQVAAAKAKIPTKDWSAFTVFRAAPSP
jgi:CHAT domain-containing protein